MIKKIAFSCCLLVFMFSHAQEINIIPQPAKVLFPVKGTFVLSATTVIVADKHEQHTVNFMNDYLQKRYGFKLKQLPKATNNFISLTTAVFIHNRHKEAYTLNVNSSSIKIKGNSLAGTFYAMQSLLQLLPVTTNAKLSIPCVSIEDAPRFAYRGMHLDVSRHFFPVEYIKKYIDYIAIHKMNRFHWHLTDDQGWRIEIKKYPQLTTIGGFRNGTIIGSYPGTGNDGTYYGGYYTQKQIKAVVKYAAERFITVIPEIEMPGHSSAAIAAYPQLSCFPNEATQHPAKCLWKGDSTGKKVQQTWGVFEDVYAPTEYTFNFLQDVLNEVMQLFPSKYIHIGGDECPKNSWKRSAFCQQLIKEKGLKDEHGLQSYFIQHIENYLNAKGRQIIGWDEILEGGLAPNATVMSWRGEKGGIEAAQQKHNVIMTPGGWCYFDHSQTQKEDSLTIGGFTSVEKVYSYNPIPQEIAEENKQYIIGAQANVWTEYIDNTAKLEYMVFPRISALSEVLWTPVKQKNEADFKRRMETQSKRYQQLNINYYGKK